MRTLGFAGGHLSPPARNRVAVPGVRLHEMPDCPRRASQTPHSLGHGLSIGRDAELPGYPHLGLRTMEGCRAGAIFSRGVLKRAIGRSWMAGRQKFSILHKEAGSCPSQGSLQPKSAPCADAPGLLRQSGPGTGPGGRSPRSVGPSRDDPTPPSTLRYSRHHR